MLEPLYIGFPVDPELSFYMGDLLYLEGNVQKPEILDA